MNFELNNRIKMLNKYSNVDALYGPYASVEEACAAIPEGLRDVGLTVGINANNTIIEYQWKSGTADENLEQKIESVNLTFERVGDRVISVQEGDPIILQFSIKGRATIQKGYVYQYINGQEIFMSDFSNITKSTNSVKINNPSASGVYTYRIKVSDTAGYNARTENDEYDYIDYEVRYGGVTISVNTSNLEKIKIKNIQSVANQYFTATISVRDNTFNVQEVQLYADGEYIKLTPYKNLSEENPDGPLGFNYYILPNEEALQNFDGKLCFFKVIYTEDGVQRSDVRELFTLLKIDSLTFVEQSVEKDYYIGFPDFYKFQLQSGVQNVSIYVQQDESSDFTFDPVTVSAYNTYSLRIIPKNITNDAHLKIICSFTINNVQKIYTFSKRIGTIQSVPERQYYTPPTESVIKLDKIVEAEERGKFEVIDNLVSDKYYTCAFMVDMYCRIQQVNDKSLKYVKISQGQNEIGYITEDIIKCKDIITDTPLNEWVQIGFGYNLEETVNRADTESTAQYFAIYINGMIVKNVQIGDKIQPLVYNQDAPITIELGNGINVQNCFVYYNNGSQPYINPNTDRYSIAYNNYLYYNITFDEPDDLPVLKLRRITDENDRIRYFNLIQGQNEDLEHLTLFGKIGLPKALNNMGEYDPKYGDGIADSEDHDKATLFRQSVNIKKPAQKAYTVLCKGEWLVNGVNVLPDTCIIEVHTQGTSTLVYPVPNFKFTFWNITDSGIEKYCPEFIQKEDGSYYTESTYTAKADFMDSSHLNNTPTCIFYNNLIRDLIDNEEFDFEGSPSARNGGVDAIMGFPVVMEISDIATDMQGSFLNIGSFMLNIDKTGDSLGFEVNEDGETLKCISFEGTSNDNESGAAGRFDNNIGLEYYESEEQLDNDAAIIQAALTASGKKLKLNTVIEGKKVSDYSYVRWCAFLSDGLEYRYPDSDIYKTSGSGEDEALTKIMKTEHFKKLYRMWSWVAQSDTYSKQKYITEFPQYFDLDYCMLYFIQLMIFAQTDNLGKNAMFDCWDGEHWYPRPYDLDSEAGLDNNGNDNIAPFVEIKPEFSLNYDPNYTREQMEENYLILDDDGTVSKIPYAGQQLDRYHFSSYNSKLWINFYKNFNADGNINAFYKKLRTQGNYNVNSIISLCENNLISSLGINQYNKDFQNKYLATLYQNLALGNRWYKFKKWMTQRFAFCDSYFNNSDTILYGLVSAMPEYTIEVESPMYIKQSYQDANPKPYFVVDSSIMPGAGSGGATKFTLVLDQGLVLSSGHFKKVQHEQGPTAFTGLVKLDVSGNTQIGSITELVGRNIPRLTELNVSDSSINTLKGVIPESLKKLTAKNVTIDTIEFPEGCLVEEIDLSGSTIGDNISFANLPNLKKINLTGCTFNANLRLERLPQLKDFTFTGVTFKGNIILSDNIAIDDFNFADISLNSIVFDGNDVNIKKLNFIRTKFQQNTINLDAISQNIEELYFNECENLTHLELNTGKTFKNLTVFSIYDSSIKSIGLDSNVFDCSKFNSLSNGRNMSQLKRVVSYNESDQYKPTAFANFTFWETPIEHIENISWSGTGENLFRGCYNLQSISGGLTLNDSVAYMFYMCENLTTIPSTITINSSVTNADYIFAAADAVPYSAVESIIQKCTNVISFQSACRAKLFNNGETTTINFTQLFKNNRSVLYLDDMFRSGGVAAEVLPKKINKFIVSGYVPSTVERTNRMFAIADHTEISVPYNIIKEDTDLKETISMFYNCEVTFTGNGRPIYNGTAMENAIDSNFFYEGTTEQENMISNMRGMFQSSNVQIFDANVFENLENLTSCETCFMNCSLGKFYQELPIDFLWSNNPKLNNVRGCFINVKNVTCNSQLRFHDNATNVNISALFAVSSYNDDNSTININIDNMFKINDEYKRTVITDSQYQHTTNTGYNGVFENRKVRLLDGDDNSSILSKLSSNCRRMFMGCRLILNPNIIQIDLSGVRDCTEMFRRCMCYKYNIEGVYDDSTRKFVTVQLPTSCSNYNSMFNESYILRALPVIRSSATTNMQSTFANCVILQSEIILPATYFQICKNRISNISYMFQNNRYITELQYDEECGLFDGCTQLSNITNMFNGCSYLHKGIPTNMFGSVELPNITSLEQLFANTNIMYDVPDESVALQKKWLDYNTIAPLVNLTSINGMFLNNRIGSPHESGYGSLRTQVKNINNVDTYVINPETFGNIKLQDIRYAFKESVILSDIPIRFLMFKNGTEAFAYSNVSNIDQTFVSDRYISNVLDVRRMFYVREANPKYIANLGIFINNLKNNSNAIMSNIAGNITNEDIPDEYKAKISSEDSPKWTTPINRPWYNVD